jgi:RimJ/RimL family protein N-acetyltransferase
MSEERAPVVIPRLTTERLLLREPRKTDFEAYATGMADPSMTKFLSMATDRRTSWRVFTSLPGMWLIMDAGWWLVERKEDCQLVGAVGAFFRESAIGREDEADLELGWTVFAPFQRNGYATEAAQAALDWGFARHPVGRAVAYLDTANVASARVAESIGMTYECDTEFYGERVRRYSIARPVRRAT